MFTVVRMHDGCVMGEVCSNISYIDARIMIAEYVRDGGDPDDLAIRDDESGRLVSYILNINPSA